MTVPIYGPTPESKADLRAGFVMSSADWARRAAEAAAWGNHERALIFEAVARIADKAGERVEP